MRAKDVGALPMARARGTQPDHHHPCPSRIFGLEEPKFGWAVPPINKVLRALSRVSLFRVLAQVELIPSVWPFQSSTTTTALQALWLSCCFEDRATLG
eukprot:3024663-Prymnesium_polylepis.1